MSTKMEEDIKRWTAKRKAALVMEIMQGKTTVAAASRSFDLAPSEIDTCAPSLLKSRSSISVRSKIYSRPMAKPCWSCVPECANIGEAKKAQFHAEHGAREMILGLQQQLKDDGLEVSLVKLCRWFEVPKRTVYYTPIKAQPKLQEP